jgi:cobalt-zinc-cadmium efflux system outer membrane protein
MFIKYLAVILIAASLIFTGCASHRVDTGQPVRNQLGNEIVAYEAPTKSESTAEPLEEVEQPTGELRLEDALALALMHNPKLAEVSWDVRISEARTLQAGLRPNPELEIEVEEVGGVGPRREFDGAEKTIRLSQLIELGGKRGARKRLAGVEMRLAEYDYEAKRLAVLTDATIGFIDVLAAQEQMELAGDIYQASKETYEAVSERVKAGRVSPLEETKASIELANRKIELTNSKSNLRIARQRLAATWGSILPRFSHAGGSIDQVAGIPSFEAVQALVHDNPQIARWTGEMEHRLAELALERAKRIFDLTLTAGVTQYAESDDVAFSFGLSMPLPIFDRNQGGVREAGYRSAQVEQQTKNAEVRIVNALVESYEALAGARIEALALQNEVVPAAGRAFEAARDGYQQGKFGYLEVLDAQRTFSEANAGLLDALAQYHKAIAVVESLIGTRLESVPVTTSTQMEEKP